VPFKAHIPDEVLVDLRRRLVLAKWPGQLPGTTWEHGADITTLRRLAEYWQTKYDWRAQEARINRFEQFTTEIDGQRIHFIHQRSTRADAIPLLVAKIGKGSVSNTAKVNATRLYYVGGGTGPELILDTWVKRV
jgi:hypothetical protein